MSLDLENKIYHEKKIMNLYGNFVFTEHSRKEQDAVHLSF